MWNLQREEQIDEYYSRTGIRKSKLKNKLYNKNIIIINLTENRNAFQAIKE